MCLDCSTTMNNWIAKVPQIPSTPGEEPSKWLHYTGGPFWSESPEKAKRLSRKEAEKVRKDFNAKNSDRRMAKLGCQIEEVKK